MSTSDPGTSELHTVLESHAVVASFWMREHAEARGLAEDLAQQVSNLQETDRSAEQQLRTSQKAIRDYRQIEAVLGEKLERSQGLCSKLREERNEAEKKALICLESLNEESAKLRDIEKKLQDREKELAAAREELAKARGTADVFAQEIIKSPDGSSSDLVAYLRSENERLTTIISKSSAQITRADKYFSEDPDKSLMALAATQKLLSAGHSPIDQKEQS